MFYKLFLVDVMLLLSEKGNYDVGVKIIEVVYFVKVKDIVGNEVEWLFILEVWYFVVSLVLKVMYINEIRSG